MINVEGGEDLEDTRKDKMRQDIIDESIMRSSNNKAAMISMLAKYTANYFGLPAGIGSLEKDDKQMSYNIFERYICFDYQGADIEVRCTNTNGTEIYVGKIIFGDVRPLWEGNDGKRKKFYLTSLDPYIDNAFSIR